MTRACLDNETIFSLLVSFGLPLALMTLTLSARDNYLED